MNRTKQDLQDFAGFLSGLRSPLSGLLKMVKPGPADVDDPTGQVAPLNYSAITNDKHWERSGL